MSTDTADDTGIERSRRSRARVELSDPAVAFVTSGAIWMLLVVGMARNPYYVPGGFQDGVRSPRGVAWLDVAIVALIVAIVAGIVYIVDHRRRRNHHPRGYRYPQKARFNILEWFGFLVLLGYIAIVIASAAQLGLFVYESRGPGFTPPTAGEISIAVIVVVVYFYHLIVFPAAVTTFIVNRRHKRRYPDESHREGHGFDRTAIGLIVANVITIVLILLIELLIPAGQLPA